MPGGVREGDREVSPYSMVSPVDTAIYGRNFKPKIFTEYQDKIKLKFSPFKRQQSPYAGPGRF
jgi:hypothetical protein